MLKIILIPVIFFLNSVILATIPSVADILCKRASIPNCEIKEIKSLTKGQRGSIIKYIKTKDNLRYVLKSFAPKDKKEDRMRELNILKLVSDNKVAPKVHWVDQEIGILMDFVNFRQFIGEAIHKPKMHHSVGQFIAQMHQIKGFPDSKSQFDDMKLFQKKILDNSSIALPKKIKAAFEKFAEIERVYRPHIKLVASHNDIHPDNLLYSGDRFWMIDWETAGLSDPFFDLAGYINFFIFKNEHEKHFLDGYKQNLSELEKHKLTIAKVFSKGYYGVCFLRKIHHIEQMKDIDVHRIYGQDNTEEFKKYLIKNRIDLNNVRNMLNFSVVLVNDFLKESQTSEFLNAMNSLKKSAMIKD